MRILSRALGIITITSFLMVSVGCGGGGSNITSDSDSGDATPAETTPTNNTSQDDEQDNTPQTPAPAPDPEEETPQYPAVEGPGNTDGRTNDNDNTPAITTIYIQEQSGNPAGSTNSPVTFAQVFKQGDIPADQSIRATLANDVALPIQVDKKATYDDGSLKHAIISAFIPELEQEEKARIYLNATNAEGNDTPLNLSTLLDDGFDSVITITLNDTVYTASAADLLGNSAETLWLSGQTVSEWMVSAPMEDAQGNPHPHLQARFNIRAYNGFDSVRVSAIVENVWAFEPNPASYSYDLKITVGGEIVLEQASVPHYHHARFRRVFWWGTEPRISVNFKTSYLKDTKAIPNYDPSVYMTESALEDMVDDWEAADGVMELGTIKPYMPGTGAREDYGVLPGWTANYLISQDDRAKTVMFGNAEQAGTFSIHYRYRDNENNTELPLSIDDWPHVGLYGSDSDKYNHDYNDGEGRSEVMPINHCGTTCWGTRYSWHEEFANQISVADSSHQPSLAYIPYLLTGDHYYLEEQMFWAAFNLIQANPYRRNLDKGVVGWDQTRGQAWSIRTLGQTAFMMPDDHPMKGYFKEKLDNNRDWYQANYVDDTEGYAYANDIGWIGYSWNETWDLSGDGNDDTTLGMISPWMNDFFTASMGHVIELGYTNWDSVMQWQGRFPVGRLYGTDYCATLATAYMTAAGDDKTGPFYDTWSELYNQTATVEFGSEILNYSCGSSAMMEYISSESGYDFAVGELYEKYKGSTANYMTRMQGAVAYTVDNNVANADEAWAVFSNRGSITDYTDAPKWAIIPR